MKSVQFEREREKIVGIVLVRNETRIIRSVMCGEKKSRNRSNIDFEGQTKTLKRYDFLR